MQESSSSQPEIEAKEVTDVSFGSPHEDYAERLGREMRSKLALIAGGRLDADTRESMIARAARRAGISFRQAKALYYAESADPRASVVDAVRDAAAAYQHAQEEKARDAYWHVVKTVTAALVAANPNMDSAAVAAHLRRLGYGRHLDRAVGPDGGIGR